jgi:hypothetical protein
MKGKVPIMTRFAQILVGIALLVCVSALVGQVTPEDEMTRLARQAGLTREQYLHSIEVFAEADNGTLSEAKLWELQAMTRSDNWFLSKGAKCAMIGVAKHGPYREEAVKILGDWLDNPRIAYMARAPGWEKAIQGALRSSDPQQVKAANWVLAAEQKRKAGDPRYARF